MGKKIYGKIGCGNYKRFIKKIIDKNRAVVIGSVSLLLDGFKILYLLKKKELSNCQ